MPVTIQPGKAYTTEHTKLLAVCLVKVDGNAFMRVGGGQYDGTFFVLGPTGRIVARDPRLAGLHLNVVEE